MTIYSESDLATEAMRACGLTSIEEPLNAVEYADAVQSNGSVIQMLSTIGIPVWNGSEIEVPQPYFVELALRCSLPLQFKNGLIDHATMLRLIDVSEARLVVMAAPRGSSPLLASSNESTGNRPYWMPSTAASTL